MAAPLINRIWIITGYAVDRGWLRTLSEQVACQGVLMRVDAAEDMRDVPDTDGMDLCQGRPHGRELRVGNMKGYWAIGMSEGLHWWQPGLGVPMVSTSDETVHCLTQGSTLWPAWTPDAETDFQVRRCCCQIGGAGGGPPAASLADAVPQAGLRNPAAGEGPPARGLA